MALFSSPVDTFDPKTAGSPIASGSFTASASETTGSLDLPPSFRLDLSHPHLLVVADSWDSVSPHGQIEEVEDFANNQQVVTLPDIDLISAMAEDSRSITS